MSKKKEIKNMITEAIEPNTEDKKKFINEGTGYNPKTRLKLKAFWLDPKLIEQLDALAKKTQRKKNSLITEAIGLMLAKYQDGAPVEKK